MNSQKLAPVLRLERRPHKHGISYHAYCGAHRFAQIPIGDVERERCRARPVWTRLRMIRRRLFGFPSCETENPRPGLPHGTVNRASNLAVASAASYAAPMRAQRGRVTSASRYIEQGWTQQPCPACAGRGIAYSRRDGDRRAPITGHEQCRACAGRGSTWRSPGGLRCEYPGGPFVSG